MDLQTARNCADAQIAGVVCKLAAHYRNVYCGSLFSARKSTNLPPHSIFDGDCAVRTQRRRSATTLNF